MDCGVQRAEARTRALAISAGVAALTFAAVAWSDQDALQQQPAPENAREAVTPLESSFREQALLRELNAITDALHKKLRNAPPVIRDSQITLKPRVYYYEQERPDGTIKEAVAGGGSLEYRSGLMFDRFRLGMELYTSQPIYAPEDRDGTQLLKPGQEGYTVLGQAYVAAKLGEAHEMTAGRSVYDTPYVNRQFNRMTPNTFEGVSLKGAFKLGAEAKKFDYLVGYLSDIKQRNSDTFIPMSQAAGSTEDHGTALTELLFSAFGASIGLAEYLLRRSDLCAEPHGEVGRQAVRAGYRRARSPWRSGSGQRGSRSGVRNACDAQPRQRCGIARIVHGER